MAVTQRGVETRAKKERRSSSHGNSTLDVMPFAEEHQLLSDRRLWGQDPKAIQSTEYSSLKTQRRSAENLPTYQHVEVTDSLTLGSSSTSIAIVQSRMDKYLHKMPKRLINSSSHSQVLFQEHRRRLDRGQIHLRQVWQKMAATCGNGTRICQVNVLVSGKCLCYVYRCP
jgi:hypothetical protein